MLVGWSIYPIGYIFGFITGDSKIENFRIYMDDPCFEQKEINEISTSYKLKKC